jgi:predicted 3-demethylubiquinone-9 3-methyltransferase (glyoxalase superfamily)
MQTLQRIIPCLWFDNQAEEAAKFYTGIFRNSKIGTVSRYTDAGFEIHKRPAGSVMVVEFELDGQRFTALNGGPIFQFSEAISLQIYCRNQEEIDYYWDKLGPGGGGKEQPCGWLKDKYSLSWQVVPAVMAEWAADPDTKRADRVMEAMLKMKKLDVAVLKRAYEGR